MLFLFELSLSMMLSISPNKYSIYITLAYLDKAKISDGLECSYNF